MVCPGPQGGERRLPSRGLFRARAGTGVGVVCPCLRESYAFHSSITPSRFNASLVIPMKTNSPSHEQISQRAQELWRQRGSPEGQDNEIWLEAERQLSTPAQENNVPSKTQGRGNGNSQGDASAADPSTGNRDSSGPFATAAAPTTPAAASAKITQQKKEARAPKVPSKTAPKLTPPESGKPLWDKPHSS